MLSILLLAAASADCTPAEYTPTRFRILEANFVPESADEDAGDCGNAHTLITAVVVENGQVCSTAINGGTGWSRSQAAAAVGQELVGSYTRGGMCWAEFAFDVAPVSAPRIAHFRTTGSRCTFESVDPTGGQPAATIASFDGACPQEAYISRHDGAMLLTVDERVVHVQSDGSSATLPPAPAGATLEAAAFSSGQVWLYAQGDPSTVHLDEEADGVAACQAYTLKANTWVHDRSWALPLYEGESAPHCVDEGVEDTRSLGGDGGSSGFDAPPMTPELQEWPSVSWKGNAVFAWRSEWFEGERSFLPLMVAEAGGPYRSSPLGEDGAVLSMRWQDGWLLACGAAGAVVYTPDGRAVWTGENACPVFWPMPGEG